MVKLDPCPLSIDHSMSIDHCRREGGLSEPRARLVKIRKGGKMRVVCATTVVQFRSSHQFIATVG